MFFNHKKQNKNTLIKIKKTINIKFYLDFYFFAVHLKCQTRDTDNET